MTIRRGQTYRNSSGWRCVTLSGVSRYRTVLVRWVTGPVKGREGRVEARELKGKP